HRFLGGLKAEFPEPAGRLRSPAASVDHDVSRQGVSPATLLIAYAADTSIGIQQPLDTALTDQRDIGMLQGTLPHTVVEQPTTVAGNIKPEVVRLTHRARGRKGFPSGEIEYELGAGATTLGTKGVQRVEKARIQRRHDLLSAPQQPVEMVALGNRFMHARLGGDVVAFEDRNCVKVIAEDPRRHQACQAPTDDDCVLPKVMCHTNLLSFCRCVSAHVLQASVSTTGAFHHDQDEESLYS